MDDCTPTLPMVVREGSSTLSLSLADEGRTLVGDIVTPNGALDLAITWETPCLAEEKTPEAIAYMRERMHKLIHDPDSLKDSGEKWRSRRFKIGGWVAYLAYVGGGKNFHRLPQLRVTGWMLQASWLRTHVAVKVGRA